jgi:low affinity Fe/Cu permease
MFELLFSHAANKVSDWAGRPAAFILALLVMIVWAVIGPAVGFSDTWQLTVNTATTIVTFLMVFVIQNSQNRDAQALQIKMDELIRATKGASNSLLDLETMSASEIAEMHQHYCRIAARAKQLGIKFDQGTPPDDVLQSVKTARQAKRSKKTAEAVAGGKPKPVHGA